MFALYLCAGQASATDVITSWPEVAPGGGDVQASKVGDDKPRPDCFYNRVATHVTEPALTFFAPKKPDGSALLVASGDGYWVVAVERYENGQPGSECGTTTFVLRYRGSRNSWAASPQTSLQDAQPAIRHHADDYGVDPGRIALLSFSTGGHLVGSRVTLWDDGVYELADERSARPDLLALDIPSLP